jgi:hypothetical protein
VESMLRGRPCQGFRKSSLSQLAGVVIATRTVLADSFFRGYKITSIFVFAAARPLAVS